MNVPRWAWVGVGALAFLLAGAPASAAETQVIFEDAFERAELGEAWRVSLRAFRIDAGVLRAKQTRSDHGAIAAVKAAMRDGVVEFRFRFEGATGINLVWDDKSYEGSHAGHLCRVAITPRQIRIGDDREGVMRKDIMSLRKDPARAAEVAALLKGRSATFPVSLEQHRWYQLRAEILGDELRAWLDGATVGSLRSPGIGHPTKREFHFTISGADALLDDVRIWAAAP